MPEIVSPAVRGVTACSSRTVTPAAAPATISRMALRRRQRPIALAPPESGGGTAGAATATAPAGSLAVPFAVLAFAALVSAAAAARSTGRRSRS